MQPQSGLGQRHPGDRVVELLDVQQPMTELQPHRARQLLVHRSEQRPTPGLRPQTTAEQVARGCGTTPWRAWA
eukprot:5063319-Pyramimonas_sp.AAC.1